MRKPIDLIKAGATTLPPHGVVAQMAHAMQVALNAAFVLAFQDTFKVGDVDLPAELS